MMSLRLVGPKIARVADSGFVIVENNGVPTTNAAHLWQFGRYRVAYALSIRIVSERTVRELIAMAVSNRGRAHGRSRSGTFPLRLRSTSPSKRLSFGALMDFCTPRLAYPPTASCTDITRTMR